MLIIKKKPAMLIPVFSGEMHQNVEFPLILLTTQYNCFQKLKTNRK